MIACFLLESLVRKVFSKGVLKRAIENRAIIASYFAIKAVN